ncbi:MAG: ABC transporter ATP-binding protein [Clostridiales bacterium]|nr:ABC transporter ATP-binding protein [Clostridiales bacterium]
MFKILKFMKKYWVWILVTIALLVVQAYSELTLPEYTSNIVDTGIMQKGIENSTPKVLGYESMNQALNFMTEDEKSTVLNNYELKDSIKDTEMPLKDDVMEGKVYQLVTEDKEKIEELSNIFGFPLLIVNQVSQMTEEEMAQLQQSSSLSEEQLTPLEMRQAAEAQYSQITDIVTEQAAKKYILSEYESMGIKIDTIQRNYMIKTGLMMLGLALVVMAVSIAVCYIGAKVGAKIGLDLRVGVFKKVINFSNAEMDKFSTASLITRSTNDIQQIQMVCTMLLRIVAYAPILGIGGIVKILNTNSSMTWILAVAVAVIMVFVGILMLIAFPKFKVMQKKVDRLNLVARETLTGLSVIRAFSREKHEEERFDDANTDLTKTMLFTNRVMTFMMPVMMIIMNALSILIIWVSAKQIDLGNLQVGTMTAFIQYSMQIIMSFLMITMIAIFLPRASVSAERIDEILTTEETVKDKENLDKNLKITKGVVKFENVSFKYPDASTNVISNIDFTAMPGQTTAIIGSTGSGKSTLINLIPRFYDVTEGKITIDGVDIKDYSQHNLREQLGYVPQKGILFSGDITSNITFGRDDEVPQEQIENYAKIAQASDFIEEMTDKYESTIAQGGTNVSGGQKQRLSIARAIAKNPKVFIFDDSFSALDYKTDVTLRKALSENVSDSTVIIVAQRIVTIMGADEIIVLDEGNVAGKGTHYELLRECDVYQQIVKSQLSEKEYELQLAQANGREEI